MKLDSTDEYMLKLLSEGKTYKEIAGKVFKSQEAVRDRLHKLRKRYSCKNSVQLVAKYLNLQVV